MKSRDMTRKDFLKTLAGSAAAAAISSSAISAVAQGEGVKAAPSMLKVLKQKAGASGPLLAGVAKKKITPSAEVLRVYQKVDPHFGGEVDQNLYARIIMLGNDAGGKLLLVSTDLKSVSFANELTAAVSRKYGIDKSACMVSGTQNHQGVHLDSADLVAAKITKEMTETILAGVGEAIAAMQPAQMAFEKRTSNINVHVGRVTPVGFVEMPDFGRFADKELSVLRVDDLSGKTLALHVNYGVQSNMMYASCNKLSGDLAGSISEYIERRLGCVCAWTAGASAEAFPLTTATLNNVIHDAKGNATLETLTLTQGGAARMRDYLTSVQAMDILNLSEKMNCFSKVFSVRAGEQEVAAAGKKGPVSHRLHLAVLNNDIAFAGVNSVASARLGKLVKDALPYRTVFVASEGKVMGYVVDAETDPRSVAGSKSAAADAWESERIYVRGFRQLAQTS